MFKDKRKFFGAILGSLMFLSIIFALTYAFYEWRSGNTVVSFSIEDNSLFCQTGLQMTTNSFSPVLDYRDGNYYTFFVKNRGFEDRSFSITLNISSISESLKSDSLKYKLLVDTTAGGNDCTSVNDTGCAVVPGAEGDFSDFIVGMNTLAPSVFIPSGAYYQYYLFVYIDGNMENDPAMQTGSLASTLDVCEIVVFLDYNDGTRVDDTIIVTKTYDGLQTNVTKPNATVTYNTNGGSPNPSSQTVSYTFDGWYLEENYQTRIYPTTEVTTFTNHILYAKWIQSADITLPTVTRTGYTFYGWYSDSEFKNKVGNAGDKYYPEASVTLYAKWVDETPPTCSLSSTSNFKATSQTVTATITQGGGTVLSKYYWGTSASGTPGTSSSASSLSLTANSANTWYLRVADDAGNVGTCSVTMNSYTVNNLLEKVDGTTGTYTSTHYASASSSTYIIKSGTSLTLASIYTVPTGASASTFKGYSTSFSTSAASLSTTAPTVSNGTTYYMWFNRSTYVLTLNTGTGISAVTGAGTYKYGKSVSIGATASDGYTWDGWTVGSGNTPASTSAASTTVTITQATTLTANAVDTTPPTCSLSSTSNFKATSQTVTATITQGGGTALSKYYWGTSSTGTPGTSSTATSLSLTANSANTWYLRVSDTAGNVGTCSVTMNSYTVNNLLEKVDGTTGTYTSTHYASASSSTYIIPSGTSLTLASIYTAPTGASASTFKGYSTSFSTSAASLSATAPTVSNGTTYYMWFNRSTYVLTLNTGTGISTVTGAGTYKYGKSVSIGATASDGYTFSKWTVGSGNTPASTTTASTTVTITQATTLTASATGITYTIAYTLNNGTGGTYSPTSGTYDSNVRISNPTKTVTVTGNANNTGATVGSATSGAQTFAGWTSSSTAGLNTSTAKTGSSSYYVTTAWTGSSTTNQYFKNLRNSTGTVTLTASWTAAAFNLPTVTKTGYTCTWNTNAAGTGTSYESGGSYTPTATSGTSITLYAKCTIKTVAVTFYRNNSSTDTTKTTENFTYGVSNQSFTGTSWTKTGYTLSGWAYTRTATEKDEYRYADVTDYFIDKYAPSVDLYAVWVDETAPTASVTSTSTLKSTSQTATLSCSDTAGVTSYYWGTSSPTSSSSYTAVTSNTSWSTTKSVTSAGTYYLACKDAAGNVSNTASIVYRSYTVYNMFLKAAGTKGTYTTANYDQASKATYYIPNNTTLTISSIYTAPTGSTFAGMSTSAPSTTNVSVTTTNPTITANANYGMWFNRTEYTIGYNACSGSGAPSSQTKRYGVNLTLSSTSPTRSGYTFKGWATGSCSGTVAYQPGDTFSENSGRTLYAIWEQNVVYLKDKTAGDFVSFTGNNGCSGNYCSGTSRSYCGSSSYKYTSTLSGWRIAYIKNSTAYLVFGGASDCLCTIDSGSATLNGSCGDDYDADGTSTHIANLNAQALKYCNSTYAYGSTCNSSSAWAMTASDFQTITGVGLYDAKVSITTAIQNNNLINNGGYYWYAIGYGTSIYTYTWNAENDNVDTWSSNKSWGLRPVIRLKTDIKVTGGSGTKTSPWTIST